MRFRSRIQSETSLAVSVPIKSSRLNTHDTRVVIPESSVRAVCGWMLSLQHVWEEAAAEISIVMLVNDVLEAPPPVCTTGLGVCEDGSYEMCGNGEKCTSRIDAELG